MTASQTSISQIIALALRWNARRVMLRDVSADYTGADVEALSRRIALGLQARGVAAGESVCLIGHNSVVYLCSYLAVLRLGAVPCALHARESHAALGRAITHVEARLVLADDVHLAQARTAAALAGAQALGIDQLSQECPLSDLPPVALPPQAPAILLLSSGTTGVPKAVVHTQASTQAFLLGARGLFGDIGPQTRHLVILGTSFAAWAFTVLPILCAGACLTIREGFEPNLFCQTIAADRINHIATVPTLIRFLTPEITRAHDLTSLKMVLCSGEAPSRADIDRVMTWAPDTQFRALYLASETGPATAVMASYEDLCEAGKLGSVGRPLPMVDLRIVDPEGDLDSLLPAGAIGEICLCGPSLAQGYRGDPVQSAARFVDGWWRSGDLGRLDEDGYLVFEGRADNMINSGGIKVYGEEIEAALLEHPAIAMAAVIGRTDAQWGMRIVAHLVAKTPVTPEEVLAFCQDRGLASFKRPREIHFHTALPLGPTGKLNRNALRALEEGRA